MNIKKRAQILYLRSWKEELGKVFLVVHPFIIVWFFFIDNDILVDFSRIGVVVALINLPCRCIGENRLFNRYAGR